MKSAKLKLLLILLLMPKALFAHGEEILFVFCSQVLSFILALIIIFFIRASAVSKFILWITYLIAVVIIWYLFNSNIKYGEYLKRIYFINFAVCLFPSLTVLLFYLWMRLLDKKSKAKASVGK